LHEALANVKETTRFRGVQLVGLDKEDQQIPRNVRLSLIERVG
jgi:hypothetical protein